MYFDKILAFKEADIPVKHDLKINCDTEPVKSLRKR